MHKTYKDVTTLEANDQNEEYWHVDAAFGVHDDIRVGTIDVRVEKDESHPGKVVERKWFERNKHIFPASRWEVFDPSKDYGTYTIHGREVNKKKK